MPKNLLKIEGEVVEYHDHTALIGIDTGDGYPVQLGGFLDGVIKDHLGERVRLSLDVLATRTPAKWKKV